MTGPRVSAVIPTYNYGRFVLDALASVLAGRPYTVESVDVRKGGEPFQMPSQPVEHICKDCFAREGQDDDREAWGGIHGRASFDATRRSAHAGRRAAPAMSCPRPKVKASGGEPMKRSSGVAFSTRAAGYGAFGGPAHTRLSNEAIVLVAMVETPQAIEQAGAIAAVEGIDAVFVGPNDLAHAMGHENRYGDAPVQAAIERALRAVSAQGICAGVLALTPEEEERYAAWGGRYFATVTTSLITRAFQQAARQGRAELQY